MTFLHRSFGNTVPNQNPTSSTPDLFARKTPCFFTPIVVVAASRGAAAAFDFDSDRMKCDGWRRKDDVLDMIAVLARGNQLCIVFDEFQDMLNVENANAILATMRGKIQFQPDTPYIFLGSVRNQMSEMFTNSRSPFYKSAVLFDIDRIDDKDFTAFLIRRFKAGKRVAAVLKRVLERADRVSGDFQELCDALRASTEVGGVLTVDDLPKALELVFSHEMRFQFL